MVVNFQLHEDPGKFPTLSEIKEGNFINWACKILHHYEATKNECLIFAWDRADTPPNAIFSKLEDEINYPLPLRLESSPLWRKSLCSLLSVGSILRIFFDQGVETRLYERLFLKSGGMLSCNLHEPSCITEVNEDCAPPVSLMSVLTHPEVPAKFKCIVRVVAAMPYKLNIFPLLWSRPSLMVFQALTN